MEVLLTEVKWQHTPAYFDNYVKYFQTAVENIYHGPQVLTISPVAGIALSLKESKIFTNCIDDFGHLIRSGWLKVWIGTIDAKFRLQ